MSHLLEHLPKQLLSLFSEDVLLRNTDIFFSMLLDPLDQSLEHFSVVNYDLVLREGLFQNDFMQSLSFFKVLEDGKK